MCEGIFVYGTLMRGFANHEKYLAKNIITVQKATIKGQLFHLPQGYPALVEGSGRVYGEYVTVKKISSVLKRLDELEDYHGPGRDNEYERVIREVLLAGGEVVRGYVYVYAANRYRELAEWGKKVLSGDWRAFYTAQTGKEELK